MNKKMYVDVTEVCEDWGVKLHFIPNYNLKLFLIVFLHFFTFILSFHLIIPKNCVYKKKSDTIKNYAIGKMLSLYKNCQTIFQSLFFSPYMNCFKFFENYIWGVTL